MNTLKRQEVQQQLTDSIISNSYKGLYFASCRVGKTKSTIDAFNLIKIDLKILVLAPFNSILDSWKKELTLWNKSIHNYEIYSLENQRSLHKLNLSEFTNIVIDEVQSLSPKQLLELQSYKGKIMGLSGTLSTDTKYNLYNSLGLTIKFTYTFEQGIKDEIIGDYQINLVPLELDTKVSYVELQGAKFTQTERQAYNYLTSKFEYFKEMGRELIKLKWAGARARFLYSSRTKLNKVKDFLLTLKDTKTLIFTGLTNVADELSVHTYHSKSDDTTLQRFIEGEFNHLSVVEMSSLGVTISNLKTIVIHQLKSSEELAIQKIMRALNYEEGEIAQIYIFYYINTVETIWINKALKAFSSNKIKTIKI